MFALRTDAQPVVERMWLDIIGYTDTGNVGRLNNQPRTPNSPVGLGDRVEFGPEHIIDALPPENWNSETGEYR